jgi:methylenetetrahydrofolate reductase (NADPH)
MRIGDVYRQSRPGLSIEIFPPKTEAGDRLLYQTLTQLTPYAPDFVSCTYGAGGTTQQRTIEWCQYIQQQLGLTATAHFTCVGASRTELQDWLKTATSQGIENIMALRGDPPQEQAHFQPAADGLSYANQLVTLIRADYPDMGIGVAGYPEKHPESESPATDLDDLKRKVDAGADAVFTQLFYSNACFLDFRNRCEQAGIHVPIVPGIMPITEFARIQRITSMCGASFPQQLAQRLEAVQHDKQAQYQIGVDHAIAQCTELQDNAVSGIHFYALNRSDACREILDALGRNPA